MPTILTHAVAGVAIAQALAPCDRRTEISFIAAACAVLPDADVLGFSFGIDYGDLLGHRGWTHSLFFAALIAGVATLLLRPGRRQAVGQVFLALFAATASHGILDAFTNGGLGVAFFAPFDSARYFFPFRPIAVSPIGITPFFTRRGAEVLMSEIEWVWTLSAVLLVAARMFRCRRPLAEA